MHRGIRYLQWWMLLVARPPSDPTFRLLLAQLDVEGFESLLQDWVRTQIGATDAGGAFAALRQLLDRAELEGLLVQADARRRLPDCRDTQAPPAWPQASVPEGLGISDNQWSPHLRPKSSLHTSKGERSHGRDITWTLLGMPAPEWVVENWPGSATVIAVRSKGKRNGKSIDETRDYITSLRTSAAALLRHVRDRWSLENSWHWPRDTQLGEDGRLRQGLLLTLQPLPEGPDHPLVLGA